MIRCWTHLHTLVSKDARLTHEEIRRAAIRRGVRAVLMTEHMEALGPGDAESTAGTCREISDGEVLFIPGLEVATSERYHVLGFGLDAPIPSGTAAEVAERIRDAGAVPVLAHPSRYRPGWEEQVGEIGAVEVWNRHYDGRLSPCRAALRGCRAAGVGATFGLDAHGPGTLAGRPPEMLADAAEHTEAKILEAFREGRARTALDGRPFDIAGSMLRMRFAAAAVDRGLRRVARRVAYLLPISAETRTRWGRRW